jgi:hypothetical protein
LRTYKEVVESLSDGSVKANAYHRPEHWVYVLINHITPKCILASFANCPYSEKFQSYIDVKGSLLSNHHFLDDFFNLFFDFFLL